MTETQEKSDQKPPSNSLDAMHQSDPDTERPSQTRSSQQSTSASPRTDDETPPDEKTRVECGPEQARSSSLSIHSERETETLRKLARSMTERSSIASANEEAGLMEGNPFENLSPELDPNSPDFDIEKWLKVMYNLMHSDPDRYVDVSLGVSYKNMRAYGRAVDANYQLTFSNLIVHIAEQAYGWVREKVTRHEGEVTTILQPMDGIIKPGEMLMVLGRPGAGCSTYLRTIASQTYGFRVDDDSNINYQGLGPKEISTRYRGSVSYCAETEMHIPQLTVGQTLLFAARLKAPHNRIKGVSKIDYARYMRDVTMAQLGLTPTMDTRVGNDLIRGVSGGERKRVSIAELSLAGSSIQCWDNSTRGLDSATANEFILTLEGQARTFGTTPLVAVYQASEEMYEMFTRVILLYQGYSIYYGPIGKARQFFIDQGWRPKPRQSTPDFLTSLTQPTERECFPGREKEVPRTPEEFNDKWKQSDLYRELIAEIDEYNAANPKDGEPANQFVDGYLSRKSPRMPRNVAYTASWWEQTYALTLRGLQRIINDPSMSLVTVLGNMAMAFIISSMFYRLSDDSGSFYSRSALLFFALLFNAFSSLLEIFAIFESRLVVQKQHMYAFYHPAIDAFASIITEMPQKIANAILFNCVIYLLPGLRMNAGNFFFYMLMNFFTTLMMSHFFRTVAACTDNISQAMIPANGVLIAMVLLTGFVIPTPSLKEHWTVGGPYINPLAYAFEALMTNEFHNRSFPCPNNSYVPYAPSAAIGSSFICNADGSVAGETYVSGTAYLSSTYEYSFGHQWRNFGIECAFVAFFMFTYMLCVWLNPGERTKGEFLVFPRRLLRKMLKNQRQRAGDVESIGAGKTGDNASSLENPSEKVSDEASAGSDEDAANLIESSNDIFYWKDVCYDVKVKEGTRRLLNYVDGWVKPGTLTALMGASGAGKTTLLDTLANRVTMGVVTGEMFVNGIPRDDSFQRTTGYVMQQDLHMETSTVREALEFSALLRQSNGIPREEKLKYVDNVVKILEMEPYLDAVIGVVGKGLNVEQRKRLTIAVELVARPKLLLFLDEPTSGLDSQTAWSICQLMKKLSNAGQAILCTIHQPSALLISQFDRLLFLARGGRTVYFGPIGENCNELIGYFEKYDADTCPADANPAEWMLHVIGAAPGSHAKHDYADVWLRSPERQAVRAEIDGLIKQFDAKDTNVAEKNADSSEYAAPLWRQYYLVSKRNFQQLNRTPSYLWPKTASTFLSALLNGFIFFKADSSIQGMQNLMFSVFMFASIFNAIVGSFVDTFKLQRDLFEARERPSKIFSWKAFILGTLTAELPWQAFSAILCFVIWYYPAGLYSKAEYEHQMGHRGGLTLFYCILFFWWTITISFMLGGPLENPRTAAHLGVLLFCMTLMFCGVLVTRTGLPLFWQFMYRVSPLTYWIHGMLALAVANAPIECADNEWKILDPPSGMTCQQYFQAMFDADPTGSGYLEYPNATSSCHYCTLQSTNQFLASIEAPYDVRWRDFGYFWVYIGFNVGAAVFIYWLARVPKSKSRVKPVDNGGRDVALEEAGQADESAWPEELKKAKGVPFEEALKEGTHKPKYSAV